MKRSIDIKCGCGKVKKFASRKLRENDSKINYLDINAISQLTPWVGCLLSDAVLNLDAFGEDFKVMYANENNEWIDILLEAALGEVIPLQAWDEVKKGELWEAQKTANAFLDKGSLMVENYEEADYVMIAFDFPFDSIAFTFLPSTTYNYPEFFNGKTIVAFNTRFLNQLTTDKGSFMYHVMLHELGHTYGLIHPFDGYLGILMPGLDFSNVFTNRGLYSQNTNLTSVMTYIGYRDNGFLEGLKTGWTTTFSPSDLEALRFAYNINKNSPKYLEYMDYRLPGNIIQTYCSDNDGCVLELIPEVYEESVFVLDMRKYNVQPNGGGSMIGFASGDARDTFTHILDRQSFVKEINNGYENLTINLDRIERDCEVNTNLDFGFVNLYINGNESDWFFDVKEDGSTELVDKVTGRVMRFGGNNDIVLNYV